MFNNAPEAKSKKLSSYLGIVSEFLQHYREYRTPEDVMKCFDAACLKDFTDDHRTKLLDIMDPYSPLPPGFFQKVFCLQESLVRQIILEFIFHKAKLVNLRMQMLSHDLNLEEIDAFVKSDLYFTISNIVGTTNIRYNAASNSYLCVYYNDLVVVFRAVPGTPSVSTHITDKDYA